MASRYRTKGTGKCSECGDKIGFYALMCRKCADNNRAKFHAEHEKAKNNKSKIPEKFLVRGTIGYSTGISSINNGDC